MNKYKINLLFLNFLIFSLSAVIPEVDQISQSIEIGVKRGLESYHVQNENHDFLKKMAIITIGTGALYCFWSKFGLANEGYIKRKLAQENEEYKQIINKGDAESKEAFEKTKERLNETATHVELSGRSFTEISKKSSEQAEEKTTAVGNLKEMLKQHMQYSDSFIERSNNLKMITDDLIAIDNSTVSLLKKHLEKVTLHHNELDQLTKTANLINDSLKNEHKVLSKTGLDIKDSLRDAKQLHQTLKQAKIEISSLTTPPAKSKLSYRAKKITGPQSNKK